MTSLDISIMSAVSIEFQKIFFPAMLAEIKFFTVTFFSLMCDVRLLFAQVAIENLLQTYEYNLKILYIVFL